MRTGLPENITEAIIQEIFERCGEITTLRLSKKNFCHIRFALEASVDAAIYLSGYRVRIGSSGDSANTGRLHVDFAQVCFFVATDNSIARNYSVVLTYPNVTIKFYLNQQLYLFA